MENSSADPRLHFVTAVAIIYKDGKFLIAKRASHEKVHPNKWCVPGGKLVFHEYKNLPKEANGWFNVIDWLLRQEVMEEVNLEIHGTKLLCDFAYVRPDGYPAINFSYWCHYKNGEVKLCKDLTDYAWVDTEEAKKYDLIEGLYGGLVQVDKLIKERT